MTRIYVVRHCQAIGNVKHWFQGIIDSEITDCGAKQLDCLAARFSSIPFDAIYSSPLQRARLTAEAVDRTLRLPIQIDDELREINGGILEGLPYAEIYRRYPEVERTWNDEPYRFDPPGGESMRKVYDRAGRLLDRVLCANPGKTVVLCSHGTLIRNLFCRVMELPLERINEIPFSNNTAVSLLEFDESGRCNIVFRNDDSHLPPELNPPRATIRAITSPEQDEV